MSTTEKIDLKIIGPATATTGTTATTPTTTGTTGTISFSTNLADTAINSFDQYDMFSLFLGPRAPLIYTLFKITTSSVYIIWISLLVLIWIISGFAAFIASFVCIFYNSSVGDKIAGLVLALFAGPFYWLFYIYNMNYCNRYTYSYY
jgi:hypothetical protein